MKLSDYVVEYLARLGTKHAFIVVGGACVHLIDSLSKSKDIKYISVQHEQAGAMAAEAYSRLHKGVGVAVATSGPGATNLLTGICCAWFDSVPVLYLTGQVNESESKKDTGVRQIGFQETDIVAITRSVTKMSELVTDPNKIKYYLDKAIYTARSGRPGPVLLDIPLNVQHAEIDPATLESFVPPKDGHIQDPKLQENVKKALAFISKAERPVMLIGAGIKIAGAEKEFREFAATLNIPIVCSWGGIDILPHDRPLFVGQIGIYGNRGANFLLQNADVVLTVGSRMDTRQITAHYATFARAAKKIAVDIDPAELNKNRPKLDLPIRADIKDFLAAAEKEMKVCKQPKIGEWQKRAKEWRHKYPACLPEYYKEKGAVNPYVFMKTLSELLGKNDIIIPDIGGVLCWVMQAFEVKEGQKLFSALGNGPMGYALPAAIGAALAEPKKRIICIPGDGGLQMNIQELQTLVHYKLPVKIFVINNNAYGIIRQFQDLYFDGRHDGSVPKRGYSAPDFVAIAKAYGIKTATIDGHANLEKKIKEVIDADGAVLCNVMLKEDQKLMPKLEARKAGGRYLSKPLEDQWPYLPREEFKKNMIIDPLPEE